jgi:AMP nucleosidase
MALSLTATEAVAELTSLYESATKAVRAGLARYLDTRTPPSPEERRSYCYPQLTVRYTPQGKAGDADRLFVKFPAPGAYATTITQPHAFGPYLIEQLTLLARDYGAQISVEPGSLEIPYPYVLDGGDELAVGDIPPPSST